MLPARNVGASRVIVDIRGSAAPGLVLVARPFPEKIGTNRREVAGRVSRRADRYTTGTGSASLRRQRGEDVNVKRAVAAAAGVIGTLILVAAVGAGDLTGHHSSTRPGVTTVAHATAAVPERDGEHRGAGQSDPGHIYLRRQPQRYLRRQPQRHRDLRWRPRRACRDEKKRLYFTLGRRDDHHGRWHAGHGRRPPSAPCPVAVRAASSRWRSTAIRRDPGLPTRPVRGCLPCGSQPRGRLGRLLQGGGHHVGGLPGGRAAPR